MAAPDGVEPIAPPAEIGFIGLGKMGLPMARRLLQAGYRLRGFDRADAARAAFAEAGGAVHDSARAAAAGCAALVTMLPDGKAVQAALLDGDDAGAPPPGALVLEMSSSSPIETRALAARLAERGVRLIDAPVSGGARRAVDGTLAIMAGGDLADLTRARPLLHAMGKSVFETGPVGSAHAMKALNNYVSAASLLAACEALRVGQRFGLDPSLMTDILNASTGRNNSTEVKLKPFVLSGSYASGFSLSLMAKDLRTADELARHGGVAAPLSHACTSVWSRADMTLGPGRGSYRDRPLPGRPERGGGLIAAIR
jgi:3-hydroxyisobutyrate dehydrogenase